MTIKSFSKKQRQVLSWWHPDSPFSHHLGIICDGAVRSGKTFSLSLSFVTWACSQFHNHSFALCGKTISSLHRNLVTPLLGQLEGLGFQAKLLRSHNLLTISYGGQENRFYLFGGKDESSGALIQGITLGGVLFDEVALMPRSFVEQALARCSVEGARFWFNCNPQHPSHWFYKEWIVKAKNRTIFYLHFQMKDNPSLSPSVLARYESLYEGVFYDRYVKGLWTEAFGAVYPMFSYTHHVVEALPPLERFIVSCDYGTTNPSSFGLWGHHPPTDTWYRVREYYHCSKTTGRLKTDEDYVADLNTLVGDLPVETVLVDPSAASFIQALRRQGTYSVTAAKNQVDNGIRLVSNQLARGKIKFHFSCKNLIREFSLYRWKGNKPLQENDHAMDELRYFVNHIFDQKEDGFFAVTARRT